MNENLKISIVAAMSLSLAGCATTPTQTQIGCGAGAILGAVIGHKIDKKSGAIVGGILGAAVGCGIGNYLDEREKKLAELAKQSEMNTTFERISLDPTGAASFGSNTTDHVVSSAVSITADKPLFATNQAVISDLEQLARLRLFLKGYLETLDSKSKIYVVGHTDSSGSALHNQKLSEQRARFVVEELKKLGANPDSLFYEGVGENQPIASNDSEAGRSRNRRFELLDVLTKDNANPAENSRIANISTAKKQRLDNVVNSISYDKKPVVSSTVNQPVENKKVTSKSTQINNNVGSAKSKSEDPLGLGGVPLDNFALDIIAKLGFAEQERGLFSKAYASDLPLHSCAYAEPVVKSTLRAYNGKEIVAAPTSDSLPNLYGTMWWTKVNSTGIALGPVGINKQNMQPTKQPIFSFYQNYKGGNVKPDFEVPVSVETYQGQDAILVRMYAKEESTAFRCSDVVFSTKGATVTKTTGVIYADNGKLFGKEVQLSLVKI